jgi:hypothetical protein
VIPDRHRESLERYARQGIPTGDCLRAVLAGDLFGAVNRADPVTGGYLVAIVGYIQNHLPLGSFGTHEIVDAWIETHRKRLRAEREEARHG